MIVRLRSRVLLLSSALAVFAVVGCAITGALVAGGVTLPAIWLGAFAISVVAAWTTIVIVRRYLRELAEAIRRVVDDPNRAVPLDDGADAEGDDLYAIAIAVNAMADEARHNERSLARHRRLLAAVADGLNQGLIAIDRERRIELINDAARVMLGVPRAPIGEPLIELVRVPEVFELLDAPRGGQAEVQLPSCPRVLLRVPRMPGGGRVLLLEDVTAMRRLETMRRDFVANVSHELRTPVAVIRANAETLISGAKDDPVMAPKLMDGLHRNAERLSRILADLLDLARLDAGQYAMEVGAMPIAQTVEQALATIEPLASSRKVKTAVEIPSGLEVVADAKALDQILVNLIENAVKYTRESGHVWIAARPAGDQVRIEVRDDGPGIADYHRTRVFERFYRVDPSRSREAGGTGLGLAIVKNLIERMGGAVGVEPNAPHGSIFWLQLPKGPAS